MCGIAGIYVKGDAKLPVDAMLSTMLELIEHRGGHATGFVALTNEGVGRWQKAACAAKEFNEERRACPASAKTIIGHTRWATQGSPGFMENNHPLKRGPFYIIHNGHVHNDIEMFKAAERGRYGLVDSECIAAHLAHGDSLGHLTHTMEAIDGAAAVAAVDERNPRLLALARGESSPLYVLETKRVILFGSTERCVHETHIQHIGKIKKARVEEISEGTMMLITPSGVERTSFYIKPPAFKSGWSWLERDNKTNAALGNHRDGSRMFQDIDYLECDVCNASVKFSEMQYVQDDGETLMLCLTCHDWLAYDDLDRDDDDEPVDADPTDNRFLADEPPYRTLTVDGSGNVLLREETDAS